MLYKGVGFYLYEEGTSETAILKCCRTILAGVLSGALNVSLIVKWKCETLIKVFVLFCREVVCKKCIYIVMNIYDFQKAYDFNACVHKGLKSRFPYLGPTSKTDVINH